MIGKIETYKGKVLPICGRPGMGQEAICLQMALKYYKETNKSVVIFSPHQPKREIQMRIVSIRDRYSYYWAKSGHLEHSVLESYMGYVRGMDFSQPSVDDTEDISEDYIVNRISNTENLGKIVLLDYDFYSDKISVDFLQMIAEQTDIPIVVSCLVHRYVDDRDDCHPWREDMKSEELAKMETVLLVYREDYYEMEHYTRKAEVLVDRGESKEIVQLRYIMSRLMFASVI